MIERPRPPLPDARKTVGHSKESILVKHVSGPVVPTGPNTLRMRFDALSPATEPARVTFMGYSRGDEEYRYTKHGGMMPPVVRRPDKAEAADDYVSSTG